MIYESDMRYNKRAQYYVLALAEPSCKSFMVVEAKSKEEWH